MPGLTIVYGETIKQIDVEANTILGEAIAATGLPLEQPCAGRGTCGKCKVLVESGVAPPDEIELNHLTPGELALDNRLACRARIQSNARVVLSPIVVYSNKNFRSSQRYKRNDIPLGLAIDLGSTTVAAFLTTLDNGQVCAGAASLNQQTVFGADVISRLAAARRDPVNQDRLRRLALASINQAVDSLFLSGRIWQRIERISVVGKVAMHHLLTGLPIDNLAVMPFQPFQRKAIREASSLMGGIFPDTARVSLPPLIGGFVGSDALACLAYFDFIDPPGPIAAIDLGTNGEVMVTDGKRILTASTAAGPAFEGVNISCGSRAVDGAVTSTKVVDNDLLLETIAGGVPIGLTGSGLLSLVHELRQVGVIQPSGLILSDPPIFSERINTGKHGRRFYLTPDGSLRLTQWDVRELQKAKGAIRASIDILLSLLDLSPRDLQRVILTGSFGGQLDIEAVIALGMIPPVDQKVVETIANGAGFGAAMFLSDEGFDIGERLAQMAEQIDLDQDQDFIHRYINSMQLSPH